MKGLKILVPEKKEQAEIVKSEFRLFTQLSTEKQSVDKLKLIKAGLMHDLLTGRVPVKVPEAAEAPAHA